MKKVLLSLVMLLALAAGSWAEDVSYIYYQALIINNSASLTRSNGSVSDPTMLASGMNSLEDGWYVADGNITLNNRLTIKGDVKLILKDGSTLKVNNGIRVNTNATLTIYAQSTGDDMGKLICRTTENDKAAIGGEKNYQAGRLIIHGGNIDAEAGKKLAAGIGGGDDGDGGTLNIYDGKVTAIGGDYSAGIGGGDTGSGGRFTMYGGDVTAEGGKGAAGIGGGVDGKGGTSTIKGGKVNAIGGADFRTDGTYFSVVSVGSAIGPGGKYYGGATISIENAVVELSNKGIGYIGGLYLEEELLRGDVTLGDNLKVTIRKSKHGEENKK